MNEDDLTPKDKHQIDLFKRWLRGERGEETISWALGEPLSSANDFTTYGMGC